VTTRVIEDEGRRELIPNRLEEQTPDIEWNRLYHRVRLKGLSPSSKSFLFKLLHQLLPTRDRINRLMPGNSPLCWCNSGDTETYLHCFFLCTKNREAGDAIARCVGSYDPNITAERMLRLQVETDEVFRLATMTFLTTGLETIWANRVEKKVTTLYEMRSELESAWISGDLNRTKIWMA